MHGVPEGPSDVWISGLFPYHLILADDERNAKEIYEDYRFYDKNVYFYPAKDLLFFQADIHGNLLIRQRMRVIRALLEQEEVTVVTSIDGCMDFLMPLEKIRSRLLHFKSDSVIDLDQLKEELVELGYERTGQVELPGQFSVRGGIIDIYPLTEDNPGVSNCGMMRWILSEALMRKARDPWKM